MSSWQESQLRPLTVMGFVDAGYLTLGAQKQLKLPTAPRIDGRQLASWAQYAWHGRRGGTVLRVYVYDGQYPGGASEYPGQHEYHEELGAQPGIRLRLGHLIQRTPKSGKSTWQQKGVDTLMVLDLIRLASLRAFDIALVIAGDRDLAEALRVIADDHAREVILYSVKGSAPASDLIQAADDHGALEGAWLRRIVGQDFPDAPNAPRT